MSSLPAGVNKSITDYAKGFTPLVLSQEQHAVLRLEREIGKLPQVELPIRHFFLKSEVPVTGGYAREMTIFAGTALVGRVHKHPCINVISKGDISVTTDNGVKRIQAPYTFVSPAGTKRAGYAHTETIWTTIHLTDETDTEKIEDALGTVTHEEYLLYLETSCHLLP